MLFQLMTSRPKITLIDIMIIITIVAIIFAIVLGDVVPKENKHGSVSVGGMVQDSLHQQNCYHGYLMQPNGNQMIDSSGRGIPCS